MSGSPGAHARFHAARLRPSDPKPALALLGRAGSHAGGRPARAATLFRVLHPMRCAREQREKLTSGDFYNHVRLRFLPCSGARPPFWGRQGTLGATTRSRRGGTRSSGRRGSPARGPTPCATRSRSSTSPHSLAQIDDAVNWS